jgi:hypothetical protein
MNRLVPALVLMLLPGVVMSQSSSSPAAAPQNPQTQAQQPAPTPADSATVENDPLLEVPPLPKSKVTLVGGTVRSIDQIRNRMMVEPFGGGKMKFLFDERTRIYRDGVETTQLAIKKGSRVYVDSQLDGPKIFARSIRVVTQSNPADADGQLLGFDARNGQILMRDRLSSQPIRFSVNKDTKVMKEKEQPGTPQDLKPGSLVSVQFAPERANRGIAQKITILAVPGAAFRFGGAITYLDVKSSTMAIENDTDGKNYEIAFDRATVEGRDDLAVGAKVNVVAIFQGDKYLARELTVTAAAEKSDKDEKAAKSDKDEKKDDDENSQASEPK